MPNTLSPVSNPQTRWARFDEQSKVNKDSSGREVVDHAASAKANLREIGHNVKDAFTANHFNELGKAANESDVLGFAVLMVGAPWAAIGEVADVVGAPFSVAKNAADAAIHGVAEAADEAIFWK